MTLSLVAPIILLVAIAVALSMPKVRNRPGAKLGVAIASVTAVAIGFSAIGYQIGKDAALRDNRADAAARSAADTATGSTAP